MDKVPSFDLTAALACLNIDPLPNKEFRDTIECLITAYRIFQEIDRVEKCELSILITQSTITIPNNLISKYDKRISSRKIFETLLEMGTPAKTHTLINTLLRFIVYKLYNCANDDAYLILNDFKKIFKCILDIQQTTMAKYMDIDQIVNLFTGKLIGIMQGIDESILEKRLHIFNVAGMILIKISKVSIYACEIIVKLCVQIQLFIEKVKSSPVGLKIDAFEYKYYFTSLCLLADILSNNFLGDMSQSSWRYLQSTLDGALKRSDAPRPEIYVIKNISQMIENYSISL